MLGRNPSFEEFRRVVDGDPIDKLRVTLPYGLTLKSLRSRMTGTARLAACWSCCDRW
jgi:hypothetical protein